MSYKEKSTLVNTDLTKETKVTPMQINPTIQETSCQTESSINGDKESETGLSNKSNFNMTQIAKSADERAKEQNKPTKKKPNILSDDNVKGSSLSSVSDLQPNEGKVIPTLHPSGCCGNELEVYFNELGVKLSNLIIQKIDKKFEALEKKIDYEKRVCDKIIDGTFCKNLEHTINDIRIRAIDEIKDLKNFIIQRNETKIHKMMSNKKFNSYEFLIEFENVNNDELSTVLTAFMNSPEYLDNFEIDGLCELVRVIANHPQKSLNATIFNVLTEIFFNIHLTKASLDSLQILYNALSHVEEWKTLRMSEDPELRALVTVYKKRVFKRIGISKSIKINNNKH